MDTSVGVSRCEPRRGEYERERECGVVVWSDGVAASVLAVERWRRNHRVVPVDLTGVGARRGLPGGGRIWRHIAAFGTYSQKLGY